MVSEDYYVLLVEDDQDATTFMLRAINKADPKCSVETLKDGQQAIAYLAEKVRSSPSSLPCVVVTDLKMPKKTGFDVLSWVQSQPGLSGMPVVVLSNSGEKADIDLAMSLGAKAYFEKPMGLPELLEIARSIVTGNCSNQGQLQK